MGDEKADLSARALQMSLAYQFVTPLTSMTIRGMADQDGLEPLIDKPPEGMCSAEGASEGQKPPGLQFSSISLPSRFSAFR